MSLIGKDVSHYRIERKVAGGGMGVIYRASDLKLGRSAVLKFLPPQLSDDEEAKERFIQEAQAASALDHPNICTIYEIGETDDGQLFIAMASYEGETLEKKIARGPLPIPETVGYLWQIADGLAKSHERDIVHRDIKPANLFVTDEGQVKILDFGLAKVLGQGSSLPGMTQGTPAYMAPEQIRGGGTDPRYDLWALGVVLYEALTGEAPFQGDTVPEIVASIFGEQPAPVAMKRPDVPPALAHIVGRLMAHEPKDRYASSAELLADLENLSGPRPVVTRTGAYPISPSAEGPSTGRGFPSRGLLVALVGLVLILVAVGLRYTTRSDPDTATSSTAAEDPEAPVVAAPDPRPALAIMFFDNLSNDPEIDWMRQGIADMLIIDLSQSSRLNVLDTQEVYQLLESNALLPSSPMEEILEIFAEHGAADKVVTGNILVVDDTTLRFIITLLDVATGEVLTSEIVEGERHELFAVVDQLSLIIRYRLDLPGPTEGAADLDTDQDLDIASLSTSSIPALRAYMAGIRLHLEHREVEAINLFEKAVELDPEFSIAWMKLAVTSRNIYAPRAAEYAARAMFHNARLPPAIQYYTVGFNHSYGVHNWPRALEAFGQAVELKPDHHPSRQNLALFHGFLEQYDEAVHHAEELIRRGSPSRAAYAILAEIYTARGEVDKADELLLDQAEPGLFVTHTALGYFYRRLGRLDEAIAQFDIVEEIRANQLMSFSGRYPTLLLQEDWQGAQKFCGGIGPDAGPPLRMESARCQLLAALFRGQTRQAVGIAKQLGERLPIPALAAEFNLWAARIQLVQGQVDGALDSLQAARRQGKNELAEGMALYWLVRAELQRGNLDAAERWSEELAAFAEPVTGPVLERRRLQALGDLALARGDVAAALEHLQAAATTLPAIGVWSLYHFPDHVLVWSSLAEAQRRSDDLAGARQTLERLAATHEERLLHPIPWVQGLYRLAELYDRQGDTAKARDHFQRFVDHWGDGDLAHDRVTTAKSWLLDHPAPPTEDSNDVVQ